jgi:hypothetical protein
MATIDPNSVCTEVAGAAVRVADGINDAVTFLQELDSMKDQLVAFAEDLGQKCSILGGLDSLLEIEEKFRGPFEEALVKIGEVGSKVFEEYNKIIQEVQHVYEEGIALLQEAITEINDAVNYAVTKINEAVDFLADSMLKAGGAVAAVLCDTLGPVLAGLPPAVVAASALVGAYVAADAANLKDPKKVAQELLNKLDLDSKLEELQEYMDPLNNLPELPDLSEYICDPSQLPPTP